MTDRNRTTVRRGLGAGGVAGAVVAVALAVAGAPGAAVLAGAIAAAAFVSAGWLLLAALLDVLAGKPPDRRRTAWTVAVTLVAVLGPFLLVGALAQSAAP